MLFGKRMTPIIRASGVSLLFDASVKTEILGLDELTLNVRMHSRYRRSRSTFDLVARAVWNTSNSFEVHVFFHNYMVLTATSGAMPITVAIGHVYFILH